MHTNKRALVVAVVVAAAMCRHALALPNAIAPAHKPLRGAIAFPQQVSLAQDASLVEQLAASELVSGVANATRGAVRLATCTPAACKGKPQFAVGYGAALALGVPSSLLDPMGNDSFLVSTNLSAIPRGSVVLASARTSTRGTLFAVYELLRDALGTHFIAPDTTVLASPAPTSVPDVHVAYEPVFEYRDNNEWFAAANSEWAARLGYNGVAAKLDLEGGGTVYASPPGFVHTSYNILAPNGSLNNCNHTGNGPCLDLYNAHNEWFWPRDDPSAYGQLCWSNASLIEFVTKQAQMLLRQQPDANIISISQNDNYNYCQSAEDMAIINEEGSPIGPLLRAVNQIARALKAEFPNVAVDTLAYQYTRPAPKVTKPEANVIVRLCTIECNFAVPLSDPSNAAFQADITNWAALTQRIYIWNYVTNFANYMQPFPNWFVVGKNIQFFAAHGVKGVFEEGSYDTAGGDMDALKDYVMGRMLWDPSQDDTVLIQQFLAAYFGKAAPFVQLYMDIMHGSISNTGFYMHESFPPTAAFLTPVSLVASASALNIGRAAVGGEQQVRVDRVRAAIYYVVLLRWDEVKSFATSEGLDWPFEDTKEAAFDTFAAMYAEMDVTSVSEPHCDLDCYKARVFPSAAAAPERVAPLPIHRLRDWLA